MADQADEQIAEAQSVPTIALAYLGFDPNAWEATPSNGYGYPYDLRTYTSGGTPVYLGLAGGANAPAGTVSLQGADRQQTTQLLAGFLASHGGLSSLAHWVAPTLDFVAMGDSFTSGESNSPFQKTGSHFGYNSSSDGCHRSGAAYAYALGRALPYAVYSGGAVSGSNVELIACSGAWTSDITTNGRDGERPQTQQLQVIDGDVFKRNPDLVTFTAGGNDAGFVGILEHCAWQHFLGYYHLGSYCADESGFVAQTTNRIVSLGPTLQQAYAEMAAGLGPDTSVMVADYPQIFPSKSDGDQGCVPRWFAGRDQDQFRLWTALLDVQVSKAARADGLTSSTS